MNMADLLQTPAPVNSITFYPAGHGTQTFKPDVKLRVAPGEDPSLALLRAAAPQQSKMCDTLLHSSLPSNPDAMRDILPRGNGFVRTVTEAYNQHRALTIRPDDVWLAILTQFCFFVNGNAEALRSTFVAHEGKKELTITTLGNRFTADPSYLARQMTELMQEHIVDPKLREWILPNFTTTTMTDRSISAIVMMGTMKEYFSYKFSSLCGIPRVTLEGEKSDWEEILHRLEGLKKYGIQTIAWYHLLRPVISRFVTAYDNPDAPENLDFWNKVSHYKGGGSGPTWLSGWITAFCVFDEHGKWQGNKIVEAQVRYGKQKADELDAEAFSKTYICSNSDFGSKYLALDGFPYPTIKTYDIPCGYTYVDIKLDDNGEKFDTMFVAGLVGSRIYSTETTEIFPEGTRDGVRPLSAWWYFVKAPSQSNTSRSSNLISSVLHRPPTLPPVTKATPNKPTPNIMSFLKGHFARHTKG